MRKRRKPDIEQLKSDSPSKHQDESSHDVVAESLEGDSQVQVQSEQVGEQPSLGEQPSDCSTGAHYSLIWP